MREVVSDVIKWGEDKGILVDGNPQAQFKKTVEELRELADGIIKGDTEEIQDAIGDIQVTLIMQAELWGLDYDECLQVAYDIIKKRTGKMVDGQFVKDE